MTDTGCLRVHVFVSMNKYGIYGVYVVLSSSAGVDGLLSRLQVISGSVVFAAVASSVCRREVFTLPSFYTIFLSAFQVSLDIILFLKYHFEQKHYKTSIEKEIFHLGNTVSRNFPEEAQMSDLIDKDVK